MLDEPLLTVENLEKHFPITRGIIFQKEIGRVRAVDGVSFSVNKGETLGVVGESGCGKSTLARLIMGLLPPTSGEVLVDGRSLSGMDRRERARLIQPVFQDPYFSLNPRQRIADIVGLPLAAQGGAVPGGLEAAGNRDLGLGQVDAGVERDPVADAVAVRVPAGEEGGPRRGADGRPGVAGGQPRPFGGKPVEVRRLDLRVAETAEVAVPEVVA